MRLTFVIVALLFGMGRALQFGGRCLAVKEVKFNKRSICGGEKQMTTRLQEHSYSQFGDVIYVPRKSFGLSIPNILTLFRVAMIPFFMLSFVTRKKTAGVLLYVLSCITDLLDGYLARKWKQQSAFGAFLDPVADKLMVSTALILLVCQLPTWWFACPVAIIMCREIGVSALREWMAEQGKRASVQVGKLGKVKTALQMISTAMLLEACPGSSNFDISLSIGLSKPAVFTIGLVLLYASTLLTVISGYQYFLAAWPTLREGLTLPSSA